LRALASLIEHAQSEVEVTRRLVDLWHLSDGVMREQLPSLLRHSGDPFSTARAWQSDLHPGALRLGQLLSGCLTHWEKTEEEARHGRVR
jgi:hypothetical protein